MDGGREGDLGWVPEHETNPSHNSFKGGYPRETDAFTRGSRMTIFPRAMWSAALLLGILMLLPAVVPVGGNVSAGESAIQSSPHPFGGATTHLLTAPLSSPAAPTCVNCVNTTIPLPSGSGPTAMVLDPHNGYLYIADEGAQPICQVIYHNVSVVDTATDRFVMDIPTGRCPMGIAYDNANGDVYVADTGSDNVSVINASTNLEIATIPVGLSPSAVAYDSANGDLYVANAGSSNVSVISGATNRVLRSIDVQAMQNIPVVEAYDHGNGEVYVTTTASSIRGNITAIDTVLSKVVANISVSSDPDGLAYDNATGTLYSASYLGGDVQVINDTSNTVVKTITIDSWSGIGEAGYDSLHGNLFIANSWSNNLDILSGTTNTITGNVSMLSAPWGVLFDPANGKVYASSSAANTVTSVCTLASTGCAWMGPYEVHVFMTPSSCWRSVFFDGTAAPNGSYTIPNTQGSYSAWAQGCSGYAFSHWNTSGSVYIANPTAASVSARVSGNGSVWAWYTPAGGVTLASVSVSPPSATLSTGAAMNFTATPSCNGGPCPNNVTYAWSLTNARGNLSGAGATVRVTAGPTPGTDTLYLNATLGKVTQAAVPVPITITKVSGPNLTSVTVSPPSATVLVNGTQSFSATPSCTGGPCPASVIYSWSLIGTAGTLNSTSGSSVTLTAGAKTGNDTLFLNASLNGITKPGSPVPITVTSKPTSALTSVSVAPSSPSLTVNGTQGFTATPTCTSTCPGNVAYQWTLNNTLGGITPATGSTTTLTAGPTTGVVRLTVTASLNGVTKWANATITITASVGVLSSVSVSPTSITIGVGNSTSFTAHPNCTGGSCPSGATYAWALNNTALGTISPTTGATETFTAGASAGSEILYATAYINGHQATGLAIISITKGTVPTLTSLTLTPSPTALVQVGKSLTLNATPSCSVSPCPSGIVYSWALNNTLGNLSSTVGPSVVFTAGTSAGATSLTVTAQLNGGSKTATSDVTISSSAVPVVTWVTIAPGSATVQVNQGQGFTANATCSPGPCPDSTTYAWTLNNSLGSVSPSTGTSTQFTARGSPGSVTLRVNATFNGKTVTSSAVITISQSTAPPTNRTSPSTFLGLPGYDGYILLIVVAAVVVAAAVIALTRRKKAETAPPPSSGSSNA